MFPPNPDMVQKCFCCDQAALWMVQSVHLSVCLSQGTKYHQFWLKLGASGLLLQFELAHVFDMMHKAWCSIEEVSISP